MIPLLKKRSGILAAVTMLAFFLLPSRIFAASKAVTLTPNVTSVAVGSTVEVKVEIDTGGEKVNAFGFSIDFSTESLEGLLPNQAGSVFPMCATLTATRYECGKTGVDGFAGQGLVTTLIFKGRVVGPTTIFLRNIEAHYGPTGAIVSGFDANSVDLTVGAAVQQTTGSTNGTGASGNGSSSQTLTPEAQVAPPPASTVSIAPATPQQPKEPEQPKETLGSESQVAGATGAVTEDSLKPVEQSTASDAEVVKGAFTRSPANIGFVSTFLLLLLAGYLGVKLYFTEKRRHLELEHLFETQLGALGALESKLDIVEQKGEGAKEKLLAELELVKNQIKVEADNALSDKKSTKPSEDGEKK